VRHARWLLAIVVMLGGATRAEAACTVSATGVSFGTYNVFTTTATTSTGTITYHCGNADHNILISISTGSSGTYVARTLTRSSETLSYNLYLDSAFATVWGDGSAVTGVYQKANPPNNSDVPLTVYGRITAQQDVTAGSYSDTVIATVNF
jgi:spore coat protein U domain-containing protein, fimbrial subunit CupE1/2/3/6